MGAECDIVLDEIPDAALATAIHTIPIFIRSPSTPSSSRCPRRTCRAAADDHLACGQRQGVTERGVDSHS